MAQYSIVWNAPLVGNAADVSLGQVLVRNNTSYLAATTANRGTLRCSGVALSPGSTDAPYCDMQTQGPISPNVTGLAAGDAGPLRVSSTGYLERITSANFTDTDEIVGYVEADGYAHVFFGGVTSAAFQSAPIPVVPARVACVNSSATIAYSYTMPENTSEDVFVTFLGRNTSNGDTFSVDARARFERRTGSANAVGSLSNSTAISSAGASGWTYNINASSTTIRVFVTAASGVNWTTVVQRVQVA